MQKSKLILSQTELKEILHYCAETGIFTWLISPARNVKIGAKAGCFDKNGYCKIVVNKKSYYAHRLAWLYIYGKYPVDMTDHVNGNPSDNRMQNLREATQSQNICNVGKRPNNTSGYKGVTWNKSRMKWTANIKILNKSKYLGLFLSPELAHAAYCKSAKELHKEFAKYE